MTAFIDVAFWVVVSVIALNVLGLLVALLITAWVDTKERHP